ncbi:MAG: hypothetical protein IM638_17145, partial [Bacteroidetes bacterium]|nr:hypothetical protein [Bacteroidota bacterium]
MARRYAKNKALNDASRGNYYTNLDKEYFPESSNNYSVGSDRIQSLRNTFAGKLKFETESYHIQTNQLPFTIDQEVLNKLILLYPRTSIDQPFPLSLLAKIPDEYFSQKSGNNSITNNNAILITYTYNELRKQKQQIADSPQYDLAEQSLSNFTNHYLMLGEQNQLIKQLIPQTDEKDTSAGLTSIAQSEEYQNWQKACNTFFEVEVPQMGINGEKKANTVDPLLKPVIDWRKKKDSQDISKILAQSTINRQQPYYQPIEISGQIHSYAETADELIQAGVYLISDFKKQLAQSTLSKNEARKAALAEYEDKQNKHERRNKLLKSSGKSLKSVKAVFESNEAADKAELFNPSSGKPNASVYPLEMFIEQHAANDFTLYLLLSNEQEDNLTVEGSSIVDCMATLADYQEQLPDGTIYFYDPYATSAWAASYRYSQRIEGHLHASDVFGYIGMGLALLAAIPTGGSSLFIAGAAFAGVASSACLLYERNAVGQLTKKDILLESGNIVAAMLPGINALARIGTFTKMSSRFAKFEKLAGTYNTLKFAAAVDLAVISANAISLTQEIIDQFADIDKQVAEGVIDEGQASEMRRRIFMQALFSGALIILAAKGDTDDLAKKFPHVDTNGIRYRNETINGITTREYENGRHYRVKPDGSLEEINRIKKPDLQSSVNQRNYTVHTDGQGNYIKRYSDSGEQLPISKAQFQAAGGKEAGSYKVSRTTDSNGNTTYTRTNLQTGQEEVIAENAFKQGRRKSYIQTDPPNQASHLDAPEIERNIVAKATTPDGHTIKVDKTGDIGIC